MASEGGNRLRVGGLPVMGIPFLLLTLGLLGGALAPLLQKLTGGIISWVFVYPLVLSNPMGARLEDGKLTLLYGFGLIKQSISLDSIEEISVLSRLRYATITRHFKAYAALWLVVVLLAVGYLLLDCNDPIGLYFAPLIISMYAVFFLVLTFPRRGEVLYVGALLCIAFLIVYPLVKLGPKTLVPEVVFALLIIWLVKVFQRDELILVVADGKSYLLTAKNGDEFLRLLRRAGNAQTP
ncbi:hypothetical protein [Thermococcus siculi]|uniref:hypothetical protein n=1 Tax=Thermococcus siculi TaxID=72803 RepID=UPI0012FD374F|nr:hypothetical protein [Thermococcus siculi]